MFPFTSYEQILIIQCAKKFCSRFLLLSIQQKNYQNILRELDINDGVFLEVAIFSSTFFIIRTLPFTWLFKIFFYLFLLFFSFIYKKLIKVMHKKSKILKLLYKNQLNWNELTTLINMAQNRLQKHFYLNQIAKVIPITHGSVLINQFEIMNVCLIFALTDVHFRGP